MFRFDHTSHGYEIDLDSNVEVDNSHPIEDAPSMKSKMGAMKNNVLRRGSAFTKEDKVICSTFLNVRDNTGSMPNPKKIFSWHCLTQPVASWTTPNGYNRCYQSFLRILLPYFVLCALYHHFLVGEDHTRSTFLHGKG
jgi:hypothetical protein